MHDKPHHVVIPKGGFCVGKPWPHAPLNAYRAGDRMLNSSVKRWRRQTDVFGLKRNGRVFVVGLEFGVRFWVKNGRCAWPFGMHFRCAFCTHSFGTVLYIWYLELIVSNPGSGSFCSKIIAPWIEEIQQLLAVAEDDGLKFKHYLPHETNTLQIGGKARLVTYFPFGNDH